MSAEAFQNIKENIELIPDEKKADEMLAKMKQNSFDMNDLLE